MSGILQLNLSLVNNYICEYGIASWAEMPYVGSLETYDWAAWPTEAAWKRGIQWRGRQAGVIKQNTPEGLEALKEHLAGGDLAVITIPVYSNFDTYPNGEFTSNDVFYDNTQVGFRGGHALTVVGYDDTREYFDAVEGVTKRGAFLLVNSWGTSWGVYEPTMGTAGFVWIAYDYFLKQKTGDPDALIILDRVNYQPTLLASIGLNHTRGRRLLVRIKGGERDNGYYGLSNPRWTRDAMPWGNDYPIENERIVIDLTDFDYLENLAVYLEVFMLTQYAGTGEVTSFSIQRGENQPIESPDAPMAPVTNWFIWLRTGLFNDAGIGFDGLKLQRGATVWADFDADGDQDMLASGNDCSSGSVVPLTRLYENRGDSTFASGVSAGLPQTTNSLLAAGDFDNDGYPDILLHGYLPASDRYLTAIYRNNGNRTFSDTATPLPLDAVSLAWADYDNDGRLDAAVSTETQILLYRNQGNGNFVQIAAALAVSGAMAWADYDNDGWVDVAVAGREKTAVFRNLGDGLFRETAGLFPALAQGSAAWGDFDGDGYLDLALSGRPGSGEAGFMAIYRNNGNSTFTDIGAGLSPLFAGSLAWADWNNDGLPDLFATGRMYDQWSSSSYGIYPHRTVIFTNDGFGSFRNALPDMPGVSVSADITFSRLFTNALAPLDWDGDGDLDLFLAGVRTYIYTTTPGDIYTGIQKSMVADAAGFGRPNTAPAPPDTLFVTAGWENGALVLNWSAGSDAETPASGLLYNVRVGTSPGSDNIVSSVNGRIMPGSIPRCDRKFLLAGLAPGTYYWAVRTIDAGMAVSDWSSEGSFVVSGYTQQYNLHISTADPSQGTTSPAPGVHTYASGTAVQLTAQPRGGYIFSHWSGDVPTPTQNPVTVTMNQPRTVTAHFSLKYNLSPDWTQHTASAPWQPRLGFGAVVFNGQMWILGGATVLGADNDVWRSADGSTWVQVTPDAGWVNRTGHVCLVYNGKMWVMGGYTNSGYLNDVWSSSDGVNWTRETAAAPWAGRYSGVGLVHDGKMWILGGRAASGWLNDVWASSDGVNWTQKTASATWLPREGHAGTIFDGKMWILGGYAGYLSNLRDAWYSTDGVTWTAATTSANWTPRYCHTALTLGDRMWILGGISRDASGNWATYSNEVWYSYNGIHWTLVPDAAPWPGRYLHASTVFNGQLWVLAGSTEEGASSAVWSGLPPSLPGNVLTLTVAANPVAGGTTFPLPGCHYDTAGAVFFLTAKPADGYRFVNWSGAVADPDSATTTTTLDTSKTVTANFEKLAAYQLTIAVSPPGSGTTIPAAGTYTVNSGTVLSLSAIPAYRYIFSTWSGAVADPAAAVTTVTVDSNKTVTAHFLPDPFAPATRIAGGENHTVFLQNEGTVWTWGDNSSGQMGDGSLTSSPLPISFSVLENAQAVAAGAAHTAALKNDGSVWAWGANADGQLGDGTYTDRTAPVQTTGLSGVIALDCGAAHTVALRNDGSVWAWGANADGQLGTGALTVGPHGRYSPVQVQGLYGSGYLQEITAISAGFAHTLALRKDGTVVSWGSNFSDSWEPARGP